MKFTLASSLLFLSTSAVWFACPASGELGNLEYKIDPAPGSPVKVYYNDHMKNLYVMNENPAGIGVYESKSANKKSMFSIPDGDNYEIISYAVHTDGVNSAPESGPVEFFVFAISPTGENTGPDRIIRYDPPADSTSPDRKSLLGHLSPQKLDRILYEDNGSIKWNISLKNMTGDGKDYSLPKHGDPIIVKRRASRLTDVFMNLSPGSVAKIDGRTGDVSVKKVVLSSDSSANVELGGLAALSGMDGIDLYAGRFTEENLCNKPTIFKIGEDLNVKQEKTVSLGNSDCGSIRHAPVYGPNAIFYASDRHVGMFSFRPVDIGISDEGDLFGNNEWMEVSPAVTSDSIFTSASGFEYAYDQNKKFIWKQNTTEGDILSIDVPKYYNTGSNNMTSTFWSDQVWHCTKDGVFGLDTKDGFFSTYAGKDEDDYSDCAVNDRQQYMYLVDTSSYPGVVQAWSMKHSTRAPTISPSSAPSSMPTAAPSRESSGASALAVFASSSVLVVASLMMMWA